MRKNREWLKKKVIYFGNLPETYMSKTIVADVDMVNCLIDELEEPEQDKVVIPQFVGDWIEEERNSDTSYVGAMLRFYNFELPEKIKNYMNENYETFARAWFDGFSVEEEKLYFVKEPITGQFLVKDIKQSSGVKWVDGFSSDSERYTEQEIKAIDERFWAFAEELTK